MEDCKTCGNCIFYKWFFDNDFGESFGFCRRYPPVLVDRKDEAIPEGWSQPTVEAQSTWCGEFKSIKSE